MQPLRKGISVHFARDKTATMTRPVHKRGRRSQQSGGRRPANIAPPTLVQSEREYRRFLGHVSGQPWLALDTESDSLFRYTPRVCLIQISVPAEDDSTTRSDDTADVVDYLIDPLRSLDLSDLGKILADDTTEVILHAAENDILTLQRDLNFRIRQLFDTQLAARILGRQGVGLAKVLEEEFDVLSDKRMQRTNWGQRPLSPQQLTYAQIDTHYLPALRVRQVKLLKEAGHWEEAQDAFRMLETIEYRPPEPRTVWQMKQIRAVDESDMGVLQAVWEWREKFSKSAERPPFKVMGEDSLVALAQNRPQKLASLREIPGLGVRQVERFGKELLAAVRLGAEQPSPKRPRHARKAEHLRTAAERNCYEVLRRWRTETAAARGVDPDIVFSNETLLQITACRPTTVAALHEIPSVGRWKAQAYGPALFKLLGNGDKS